MKSKPQKTYSVSEAAKETGYHRNWISRLCQAGKIGKRIDVSETNEHRYRITQKEIAAINADKKQGLRQSCKKSEK